MESDRSPWYAWYVVIVLMIAYLFSYVDRSILSLLVNPIRADLGLNDTQVSLLHGFAFAIFYTLLGFPVGRLADRSHRVRLVTIGIGLWSLFTMACGLARNFWQLFAMRVGVGVGEATLNPCAYSIITDSVDRRHLSRALSVYVMGTYMGFGAAFIVGGLVVAYVQQHPTLVLPLIGELRSWQATFFYVGAPGFLVMALIALTLKEPQRTGLSRGEPSGKPVPIADFIRFLGRNRRTVTEHVLGFSLVGILVNGVVLWTPSFLHRSFGWAMSEAGIVYGLILLLLGPLGIFLGGVLADRIDRRGERGGPIITAALFTAGAIIPAIFSTLASSPVVALVLIAWLVFCSSAPWGVAVSALQQITPNEFRGQIAAVYLFVVNIIGIGLGPTLIALITDYGFANDAAVGRSMSIVAGAAAVAATALMLHAIPAFRRSLHRARAWSEQATST